MPRDNGKYRVYVYFNGYDVKGSPFIMRVGTKGRSGKTRSSPHHENKHRAESPSMHYTTTSSPLRPTDFRTAKKELYAQEAHQSSSNRSFSPQYSPLHDDSFRSRDFYATKRDSESYSPRLQSPKRDDYYPTNKYGTEIYSTSMKSTAAETKKHQSNNDYYYNKENELFSKKNDTHATLISPRNDKPSPTSSGGYVSKSFTDKYMSRQRNESFSPIESPVHVSCTTAAPQCRNQSN